MGQKLKEHNIKYGSNKSDSSVILFDMNSLVMIHSLLELSIDFLQDYKFEGENSHYLKSNLLQRLIEMAETEEDAARIRSMYIHLTRESRS